MLLRFLAIIIVIITAPLCAAGATVNTDFLAGIGDFESCAHVRWYSGYDVPGYDFGKIGMYVEPYGGTGLHSGYSLPSADNTVGDGWNRYSGANVDPGSNVIFRILSGGVFNSNLQYFALKGTTNSAEIALDCHLAVNNSNPNVLHTGDRVTFRLDYVRMSDFAGLPNGTNLRYYMKLAGASGSLEITPSVSATAAEVTATIPSSATEVVAQILVQSSGTIGSKQPGIYVDGARLYVKRAGSDNYEQREVPVNPQRTVTTQNYLYHATLNDTYLTARDYDSIVTHEDENGTIATLRYLHPSMRIYLYESGGTCKEQRDSEGKDKPTWATPFTFFEVQKTHPEWLYTTNSGGFVSTPGYSDRYFLRIADSACQNAWAERIIERAKRYGVDGVFIDDVTASTSTYAIDRKVLEVQQFMHAVYPKLRAAGLEIIQNSCGLHLTSQPDWLGNNGLIYYDAFWIPNAQYPGASGYTANSPDLMPDVFFQEWAFFQAYLSNENSYDKAYWLASLQDMDTIKQWNTAIDSKEVPKLGANQKRRMHLWVKGRDLANDPASGTDGWVNFGLCSYLLAQNTWTALGFGIVNGSTFLYPQVDYSVTKRLGAPDGDHFANVGDAYCRWRRYKATNDGGLGGVVVVNGNASVLRTYTIDFDATDESGNIVPSGTKIKLKPHTGRIFLQRQLLDVQLIVPSDNVYSGQTLNITVEYKNKSTTAVKNVTVRIQVPNEMTYVAGSAEKSGGRYYADTTAVVWTVPSLVANGTGTRTFSATVK